MVQNTVFPVDRLALVLEYIDPVPAESASLHDLCNLAGKLSKQLQTAKDPTARLKLLRQMRLLFSDIDQELARWMVDSEQQQTVAPQDP